MKKKKKNYGKKVQDVGRCQMEKKRESENSDTVESIRVQNGKKTFQCSNFAVFRVAVNEFGMKLSCWWKVKSVELILC